MHIDPVNGLGLEAAKQFARAGGTHIILVGKTLRDWGIEGLELKDFILGYQRTIKLAESICIETDAMAYPVLGLHPSEFLAMIDVFGPERAYDIALSVMEHLESLFMENRIFGIGEIGRPHFPVDDEKWSLSNKLMEDFLALSAKIDCAVQLHTEHFTEDSFTELSTMISKNGNPKRVVKHFSPPLVKAAEDAGVYPSIVSSKGSIKKAISSSPRFLMETDYIDDRTRPGAVMGPKTVPKRTKQFLDTGIFTEEDAAMIHEELVTILYGIDL